MTAKATLNGNITATGGENCDERGFEWGTTQGGPYDVGSWSESGSFGTGAFDHVTTGLTEETLFYYRAKAHNSGGWGYGDEQSFTTWGGKSASDSGAGSETATLNENLTTIADNGTGSEAIVSISDGEIINAADSGAGVDALGAIDDAVRASENGAASETPSLGDDIQLSDQGAGSDAVAAADQIPVSESGAGTDSILLVTWEYYLLGDTGLGIDTAYLAQGEISLDAAAMPHVLTISVDEPSVLQDLPVMDTLPYRKQLGKSGRSLRIQGWTDSLSTLETLRGYNDGEKHLLVLPTGDSMSVHVTGVETPEDVENYDSYDYTLVAVEAVD
jgi:hypothetical protein